MNVALVSPFDDRQGRGSRPLFLISIVIGQNMNFVTCKIDLRCLRPGTAGS
jgi:hypothetical protein